MHFSVETLETEHRWFSGRMLACHAGGPGSIPGRCTIFIFFQPAGRTIFSSEISTLRCTLVSKPSRRSIGGSVVECSPATRAARVRFPADARFLSFFSQLAERFLAAKFPRCDAL
ncbi:hypothetical protein CEXT_44821 [Caerostris extrusa]|uniref:Uncharacterized protein n=1 Tax=Caerostris extrusa TaxID=172846 RepID=A0AAV4TSW0_CAEEX|nr:hypothetical protein CEXT_44781 [Caerostris extrusa]GIY48914.1 hypothetical protein CEXT_44791 [Caerostris extrusa]GIY48916.1 hypothetical protein CEXT_44801 [Caerostris extrusa]GIY48920.1 hypothetical protein CEXT_44821 [Caerostris extrusa]